MRWKNCQGAASQVWLSFPVIWARWVLKRVHFSFKVSGALYAFISLSKDSSFDFNRFPISCVTEKCHFIISCSIMNSYKVCHPKDYTLKMIDRLTKLNSVAFLLLFGGSEGHTTEPYLFRGISRAQMSQLSPHMLPNDTGSQWS